MSKNFITHIPNVHNWAKIKLIFILSEIFQNETIKSYSTEKDDIGRGGGGWGGLIPQCTLWHIGNMLQSDFFQFYGFCFFQWLPHLKKDCMQYKLCRILMEYQVCCKCNLYINITSYVSHTNSDLNLIINKINIYSNYIIWNNQIRKLLNEISGYVKTLSHFWFSRSAWKDFQKVMKCMLLSNYYDTSWKAR